MLQESQDVDCAFVFYLLQHAVNDDVGTCPAHTSAGREANAQLAPLLLEPGAHRGRQKQPPGRSGPEK